MRLAVVGTGYVGLVSGACFADLGWRVVCVDSNAEKIRGIMAGRMPIFEPGLEALVRRNVEQGRLAFGTDLGAAVAASDLVFLAVGTPPRPDGTADLSFLEAAVRDIGGAADGPKVIVTKSTVPAGTGARIKEILLASRKGPIEFEVVSNPEFLREGSAIEDFMHPARIVVGADSPRAAALLEELYRPLTNRGVPLLATSIETAEMIKYASNAFLATKVAFINEVAGLCERVGADVRQVARGMGLDPRIGALFLNPGPGYGGSCFPKDTEAFAALAGARGARLRIVEAVIESNRVQRERCLEKIVAALGGTVQGKRIAALGLSFKPDTDDLRESPAVPILAALVGRGARVRAFDPQAMAAAQQVLPGIELAGDSLDAARGADLLVVFTEWNEFRALPWDELRSVMASPAVVDLRNLYDPGEMARRGFRYTCVGRPSQAPVAELAETSSRPARDRRG